MTKSSIKTIRTENGRYTFSCSNVSLRIHQRGARGWSFINAPPPLLGRFTSLEDAKKAFTRYMDAAAILDNPLIDDDVDRETDTVLDPDLQYGPPPRRRPDPMTEADAEAHLREKLGH